MHPGVIDADFTGQVCAMVSTPTPPAVIPAHSRIAQLVPFESCVPRTALKETGDQGFGSTSTPQGFGLNNFPSRLQLICELTLKGA